METTARILFTVTSVILAASILAVAASE